jgi:hypothetical protein
VDIWLHNTQYHWESAIRPINRFLGTNDHFPFIWMVGDDETALNGELPPKRLLLCSLFEFGLSHKCDELLEHATFLEHIIRCGEREERIYCGESWVGKVICEVWIVGDIEPDLGPDLVGCGTRDGVQSVVLDVAVLIVPVVKPGGM